MLRSTLLLVALAGATAFAPGSVLPTSASTRVRSVGPMMQRRGSTTPPPPEPEQKKGSLGSLGSLGAFFNKGSQGSVGEPKQGSQLITPKKGSQLVTPKKAVIPKKAAPKAAAMATQAVPAETQIQRRPEGSTRFSDEAGGTDWDVNGAEWARGGGIFAAIGDVTWAREAEVKHARVCMLAATGAIVQDVYTFPFMNKWYKGEKMWGLHDAAIQSGALWQVLAFIGLLELPFVLKLANGSLDGTGDLGFDPLGMKNDVYQINEIKNGRLAMIAIGGMTHHYFLTGKGPIDFITHIPNFKSCAAAAVDTGLCK